MYKVFVENLPVIFTDHSENYSQSVIMEASEVNDIISFVRSKSSIITNEFPLVIHSTTVEKDFNRIFQSFQRVVAAGGIVCRGEELLMIRKNGFWDLPKGFVDQGEQYEECAYREIMEECGVAGHQLAHYLLETMHTYHFEEQHVLKTSHWFLFHYDGSKVTSPQRCEGIQEAKWIAFNEINSLMDKCYGSIRDVFECYSHHVKN